ncbi:hypothetical protein [Scytonema hofmannii]|uniref:hypothetical protein n=1 Tax=Scytonema hofmannii TaxID=34078 RepID=UPI00034D2AB2|nr:hypothetical protein [Scytonema hofmannii]
MITTISSENQLNSSCSSACLLELYVEQAWQLRGKLAVDEQLQNLIHEVCRHADLTAERQKALNRLLVQLQQLPGIYKSTHQDYPQALNDTWQWVCRSICDFQPRHSLVQQSLVSWINGYLKWRIVDLYAKDNQNVTSLDKPIRNDDGDQITLLDFLPDSQFTSLSLDLLDIKILQVQEGERQRLGQQIKGHIIQDTQGTLSVCHPRKHPECHCQLLAKRLLLQEPPEKISDIAREFEMNNQTLYSHWKQKCLPLLVDIGRNCGYKP